MTDLNVVCLEAPGRTLAKNKPASIGGLSGLKFLRLLPLSSSFGQQHRVLYNKFKLTTNGTFYEMNRQRF